MPFLTFITPVFNTEKYLRECIESVLKQSNSNWELILIDDGSSDGSGYICDQYAEKDNRITVIHQENSGQFKSRLVGISIAKGEYCAGLDSDDYLESTCVCKLEQYANSNTYDILTWNMRSVDCDNVISCDSMPFYGNYSRYDFMKYVISSSDHSFCNKLIKSELLKNAFFGNVPFEARHSEDYILICPAICQAGDILAIDETLYNYRQLDNSTTHIYTAQRALDYMNSYLCIQEIWAQYDMLSPEFQEAEEKVLFSSVGNCLKQVYKNDGLSKEVAIQIREHPVFKKLKAYENTRNATLDVVIFMKLFRHRMNFLLDLIYKREQNE